MTTKQRESLNQWYRARLVLFSFPFLCATQWTRRQLVWYVIDRSMPDSFLNDDQLSNEDLPTSFNVRCMCATGDMMKYNFFFSCDKNECRNGLIACNFWWVAKRDKRSSPCFTGSNFTSNPKTSSDLSFGLSHWDRSSRWIASGESNVWWMIGSYGMEKHGRWIHARSAQLILLFIWEWENKREGR